MCAFCSVNNHSFKFTTCLVVVAGVYAFLHWFLAVPLLYFHLYECCNQKFPRNWIVWFLAISFVCWLGVSILIAIICFCLRLCKARHLNESNVLLTGKVNSTPEEKKIENTKTISCKKNAADILVKSSDIKNNAEIVVYLPDFSTSENLTVLKMNEHQHSESPVLGLDFPIPMDECRNYVQTEFPQPSEKDSIDLPLKTPREIFFKDLIEAVSKSPSYFDFDPEKVSRDLKKKFDLENLKEEDGKSKKKEEKNFFVGLHTSPENFTSEVMIILDEKNPNLEEPENERENFDNCKRYGSPEAAIP